MCARSLPAGCRRFSSSLTFSWLAGFHRLNFHQSPIPWWEERGWAAVPVGQETSTGPQKREMRSKHKACSFSIARTANMQYRHVHSPAAITCCCSWSDDPPELSAEGCWSVGRVDAAESGLVVGASGDAFRAALVSVLVSGELSCAGEVGCE